MRALAQKPQPGRPPLMLWTARDAGNALGRSPDLVKYLARTGRLRVFAKTPSGVHLFTEADVRALQVRRALRVLPSRPRKDTRP
jgi:hypothetical protein